MTARNRPRPVSWVVYRVTLKGQAAGPNAVCELTEWEEMERRRPGGHTLIQSGIASEGEAERLDRGTAGDPIPRPVDYGGGAGHSDFPGLTARARSIGRRPVSPVKVVLVGHQGEHGRVRRSVPRGHDPGRARWVVPPFGGDLPPAGAEHDRSHEFTAHVLAAPLLEGVRIPHRLDHHDEAQPGCWTCGRRGSGPSVW